MNNGTDLKVIREVMDSLPLIVISEDGKTFEMKIEMDIRDINSNTFNVSYRHTMSKEVLFEHPFLLDGDPAYGIDYFNTLFKINHFKVFKTSKYLALEEGKTGGDI